MKKKKSSKKPEMENKKVIADKPHQQDEGKPFDFGILPNRDLKKNLGCG